MATNNHALIRYKIIDQCIRQKHRVYHVVDLIEACNQEISAYSKSPVSISRRTLLYDLKFLKDPEKGFGAPIVYDSENGYHYDISGYSIFNIPFKKSDLELLSETINILENISGHESFNDLKSTIERIRTIYNLHLDNHHYPIVQFDVSHNISGQKWIDILRSYIRDFKSITVQYKPFEESSALRTLSPYLIKEYNNRWFLIAYDHQMQKLSTLGMDRINQLDLSLQNYVPIDSKVNISNLMEDIVGVTLIDDEPIQEIVFKSYGVQTNYLLTKPIHKSQTLVHQTDDEAILIIMVIPNYELESHFLSFGDQIEVISPLSLRNQLKKRLSRALDKYSSI
jgi:predicted DNA-binding transcriptional regulator YafY